MESGEDARKKRDYPHAEDEHTGTCAAEKSKKFRPEEDDEEEETVADNGDNKQERDPSSETGLEVGSTTEPIIFDIETGLDRILQREHNAQEFLSDQTHVTFRAGHSGDASAIESWYRKDQDAEQDAAATEQEKLSKEKRAAREDEPSSSLELWLSEGMGDEDTHPPSVFSILAEVSSVKGGQPSRLGAAALFTLAWGANQRVLRIEWCHVDRSLPEAQVLARRMWLRLSALALMTGCCLWASEDSPIISFQANDASETS